MNKPDWHFVVDTDHRERGWWCFDIDGYYISIGAWPSASSAPRASAALLTYKIARRDSGKRVFVSSTKFAQLKTVKKRSLATLRDFLRQSITEVETALADEHFTTTKNKLE